jgi:hypothetical protein
LREKDIELIIESNKNKSDINSEEKSVDSEQNFDTDLYSHLPYIPSWHGASCIYKENGIKIPAPKEIN